MKFKLYQFLCISLVICFNVSCSEDSDELVNTFTFDGVEYKIASVSSLQSYYENSEDSYYNYLLILTEDLVVEEYDDGSRSFESGYLVLGLNIGNALGEFPEGIFVYKEENNFTDGLYHGFLNVDHNSGVIERRTIDGQVEINGNFDNSTIMFDLDTEVSPIKGTYTGKIDTSPSSLASFEI